MHMQYVIARVDETEGNEMLPHPSGRKDKKKTTQARMRRRSHRGTAALPLAFPGTAQIGRLRQVGAALLRRGSLATLQSRDHWLGGHPRQCKRSQRCKDERTAGTLGTVRGGFFSTPPGGPLPKQSGRPKPFPKKNSVPHAKSHTPQGPRGGGSSPGPTPSPWGGGSGFKRSLVAKQRGLETLKSSGSNWFNCRKHLKNSISSNPLSDFFGGWLT